ncbi:hypothetical protein KVH24_31640 [Streptomyces olivaceus]|uniref:hypothetical protein n=1 Tax=Streptomyces olivaceus TaxID=47716 RepID=UPI001CC9B2F1|nr:hypothetical protein [Streptomyces olivaceus]MBZ6176458.1 hypothetical protein [Streptomyces olivaceus]MBZ6183514.1 hypothetical protein [Streptomyces olivaceus]
MAFVQYISTMEVFMSKRLLTAGLLAAGLVVAGASAAAAGDHGNEQGGAFGGGYSQDAYVGMFANAGGPNGASYLENGAAHADGGFFAHR